MEKAKKLQFYIRFFLFRLFFILPVITLGQSEEYAIKSSHFSIEHGLSQRFVLSIFQDSRGFLWLGTQDGLNRFDGSNFKVYSKEEHGLQSNYIWRLLEDPYQRLWVIYQKNAEGRPIDLIDLKTETVTSFDSIFSPLGISDASVHVVENSPEGSLLIGTTTGTTYHLETPESLLPVFENPNSHNSFILPLASGGFLYIEPDLPKKTLFHKKTASAPPTKLLTELDQIVNIDNMDLRLATVSIQGDAYSIFDFQKERLIEEQEPYWLRETVEKALYSERGDLTYLKMAFDSTNHLLWLGYRNQLWAIDQQGKKVLDLSEQLKDILILGINILFLDRGNNLWIGTNSGLLKISLFKKKFQVYAKDHDPVLPIRAMALIDSNTLLFNAETQAYLLNLPLGNYQKLDRDIAAYSTLWEKDSSLYFANYGLELNRLIIDPQGTTKALYTGEGFVSEFVTPYTLFKDRTETLWIGSSYGLAYFDQDKEKVELHKNYGKYSELSKSSIQHALPADTGIWLATSIGLYRWQAPNTFYARYATDQPFPHQLPVNNILFVHQDKKDKDLLWLGTRGDGLICLNTITGDYQHWTRREGLSDNVIYAIYEDDFNHLWLSSNYGIMQFNKESKTVNTYLVEDGIAHEEFNTGSHLQLNNDRIFFGGLNGITTFDPADFYNSTRTSYNPPFVLTKFSRFDRKLQANIDDTELALQPQRLIVRPQDLFIDFDFALLDFEEPREHVYSYKIEGLSDEWQLLPQPRLRLYSLPPGQYTLRLKARNTAKSFLVNEMSFDLLVLAPFYQQWWFIGFIVVLVSTLVFVLFKYRIKQAKSIQRRLEQEVELRTQKIREDKQTIEAQAQKLKNLDRMKSRFYANISHELRTPLTLILSPVKALLDNQWGGFNEKGREILKMIKNNSTNLLKLVQEILDLSKLEADKLELEEKPQALLPFIRKITAIFESKATFEEINFTFKSNLRPGLVVLIDPAKVEKTLNNLLSNAFKFTSRGGSIQLIVTENKSDIQFDIIDSGIGISEQDLPHIFDRFYQSETARTGGTGIGLAFSYELAQLMQGSLRVSSQLGIGSTFVFTFPKKEVTDQPVFAPEPDPVDSTESANSYLLLRQDHGTQESAYRILVVEDNRELQQFIRSLLVEEEYQVVTADNGKRALEYLEHSSVDLIISDIMMPEMDGFALLRHIKDHPKWRNLPIIMLTARAAQQDKLTALRIGVDDYLVKPFDHQELSTRIANLLHNYQERIAFQESASDSSTESSESQITEREHYWQIQFENVVLAHLNNSLMSVSFLADQLHISERQLYRQVKRLTGLTPNNFIRNARLQKAKELLEQSHFTTVNEVCFAVGFQKSSYFSKLYYQHYGRMPSSYFA